MFNLGSQRPLPYKVQLCVARQPLGMEVNTGASLSVISWELYNSLFSAGQSPRLVESRIILRTYTTEEVKPKGSCSVNVCYVGFEYSLPLLVVGGKGPALLSRN